MSASTKNYFKSQISTNHVCHKKGGVVEMTGVARLVEVVGLVRLVGVVGLVWGV